MNNTSTLIAPSPNESEAEFGWSKSLGELLRIRSLENDWDDEGSPAPETPLVDGAIRLALELRDRGMVPPDFVLATDEGTVHLEWRNSHEYREIEVLTPFAGELRRFQKDEGRTHSVSRFDLGSYPFDETI